MNHPRADGLGNGGAEDKCGDEIPKGGPKDGVSGSQHASGDDGGDGVGGVMPAVGEIEGKSDGDNQDDEMKTTHGVTPGSPLFPALREK